MVLELNESSSAQPETAVDMESLLQGQEGYVARPGEIRKGRVIQVTEDGALVDVGLKREGFVPASDLRQVRKEMGKFTRAMRSLSNSWRARARGTLRPPSIRPAWRRIGFGQRRC